MKSPLMRPSETKEHYMTNSNNGAPVVVYVNWEGRGYSLEDWKADLAVITANVLGKCWWAFCDVGLLVSSTPTPDFTNVVTTRYGQSSKEDWTVPITLNDGSQFTLDEHNHVSWTPAADSADLHAQLVACWALDGLDGETVAFDGSN
jgi:hypothetical protein